MQNYNLTATSKRCTCVNAYYDIARYVVKRYKKQFGIEPDEMKLHKLLYFLQRECIVMYNQPLFVNQFEAGRYGPVMKCLRSSDWKAGLKGIQEVLPIVTPMGMEDYSEAVDIVFERYAGMKSWTLSNISHGESCWKKAKDKEADGHPVEILTSDIRIDAENIKLRRVLFPN